MSAAHIVTRNDDAPQAPMWRQRLYDRGLSDAAIEHFQICPSGDGWIYPVSPDVNEKRWKAFDSDRPEQKYRWSPRKPQGLTFYDPGDKLARYVAEADNKLWIAAGEPDVWALWEGEVRNATCLLLGEANALPAWFLPELKRMGVQTVHIAPDRDSAGTTFANNVQTALVGTDIELIVLELPFEMDSKGDIGQYLLKVGSDALGQALARLPEQKFTDDHKAQDAMLSFEDLFHRWGEEVVEPAALTRWDVGSPNAREYSKNFNCPFHDDHHPSASWNYRTHSVDCFTCGSHNIHKVAAELRVQSWEDFKVEYQHQQRPRRSQGKGQNGSENETGGQAPTTHRAPTHDEIGDALLKKWSGNTAYLHGSWYRYGNGFWQPEPNIKGDLWNIQKEFKSAGIKPTDSIANSVESYVAGKIYVPDDEVNNGQRYVNMLNGLLDLDTGERVAHQRDLYLTSQLAFEYDPDAQCPTWEQCLSTWLVTRDGKSDEHLMTLLQEAFGYSLTADTSLEKAFWLYGPAGSGKSTVLRVLQALLGNAHTALDLNTLEKNPYQLASLVGKRATTCTEARTGMRLPDHLIKPLISGEATIVRQIYGRPLTLFPQAKIWWAMNDLPINDDRSDGIRRRLVIIPFNRAMPAQERDPYLFTKLKTELQGIFNWALEGLRRLRNNGAFTNVEQVQRMVDAYQQENDIEQAFVDECCVVDPDRSTQSKHLYTSYNVWCHQNGHKPKSSTKVAGDWERLGFDKYKDGCMYYSGVALKVSA